MAETLRPLSEFGKPEAFASEPFYSREGDCLHWFFRPDENYAERIDGILTVYRAIVDDRIVGIQIKEIKKIVRAVMELLEPTADALELKHIVFGANMKSGTPTDRYRPVVREAGSRKLSRTILEPAGV